MTAIATTEKDDASAYSAVWSVPIADGLIRGASDQFETWMRGKKNWDQSTKSSGYFVGPDGNELLVVHRESAEGTSLRLRLTEKTSSGTWRTSLTAHAAMQDVSWLRIRVANSHGMSAKVPWLASYLLSALELRDGATWLSAKPRIVGVGGVEDLAEEVTDLDRRGLYFVAGTDPTLPIDAFAERVERWTADTRGMAQVAILDPDATREFALIMGSSHRVPAGTIRTFYTEVDPAVAGDGRRHRILGAQRLAGSDSAVRAILGRVARTHATQRPLPSRYAVIHRALARLEDKLLVDSLLESSERQDHVDGTAGPALEPVESTPQGAPDTASDQVGELQWRLTRVMQVLGVTDLSTQTLTEFRRRADLGTRSSEAVARVTRKLDERLVRIEELEFEVLDLRELSEDQELELAESLQTQSSLTDEVRWLRGRLAEAGESDGGYGLLPASEATPYPNDYAELVEKIGELAECGVVFTGDGGITADLVENDTLGRSCRVAWECLLTLGDYVRARRCGDHGAGVRQYLESPPSGYRGVPPKKFAAKETAATMRAWGEQRSFCVPATVDPAGEAFMEAHFKLGRVGMVSPRMYYLDNYTGDGNVYVGYIGGHLRNTKTN